MKNLKSIFVLALLMFTITMFSYSANGNVRKSPRSYVQSKKVQKKAAQIRGGNQLKCKHGKHITLQQMNNRRRFLFF